MGIILGFGMLHKDIGINQASFGFYREMWG